MTSLHETNYQGVSFEQTGLYTVLIFCACKLYPVSSHFSTNIYELFNCTGLLFDFCRQKWPSYCPLMSLVEMLTCICDHLSSVPVTFCVHLLLDISMAITTAFSICADVHYVKDYKELLKKFCKRSLKKKRVTVAITAFTFLFLKSGVSGCSK